jgi:arsenate reductase (thioredoxin)
MLLERHLVAVNVAFTDLRSYHEASALRPRPAPVRAVVRIRRSAMKEKILFLCTGNSCRSQMAEAWANRLRGDRLKAWSAGTHPKAIDPFAIRAMQEHGIDISAGQSKHVKDLLGIPFDYVVTVCDAASQECPLFPAEARILHQGFDDPPEFAAAARTDEERMAPYRRVCLEIRDYILTLPGALDDLRR